MADWGLAPTILIFADGDDGLAMACDSALARGGRIAAALPIAGAADRLDDQIAVDLVILDITCDHGPLLDKLLGMIEEGAQARRFASVVTIAPDLIDIATARIGHHDVSVLVGRDPRALDVAIGKRLARREPALREVDDEEEVTSLHHIVEEMERLGRAFASAIESQADRDAAGEAALDPARVSIQNFELPDAAGIREIIRARRFREELFGAGLFADPAWDILLDLTAARVEGRSVAVSSLCIAAAVPATTALRWIKQLTDSGLLNRVSDPVDGRRVFIELTDYAATAMTAYFAALSPRPLSSRSADRT